MAHGTIYIRVIEINGDVEIDTWQTLEENGNAQEFYNHLQTGDGGVTQLTGNTDNYAPTNWDKRKNFAISASTPLNITGWAAGEDWEEKRIIIRDGSSTITLTNADTSSNFANRMYNNGNVNLVGNPKDIFIFVYDPGVNKWRVK